MWTYYRNFQVSFVVAKMDMPIKKDADYRMSRSLGGKYNTVSFRQLCLKFKWTAKIIQFI